MDILDGQRLQLWGGLECTRNRVGKDFHDQFERSGHRERIDDLSRIAELGIKVLRYPALWEWASRVSPNHYEWTWIEERLKRLRQLQIETIVGFVHHGSGPPGVDLLDNKFASGLEAYATAFASRFPWVSAYTPVNEPLTTARFSALYGHWYPHAHDNRSFALAMLNQCRAIVLAMHAVRRVNPKAKLVQTEDLGKTFASPSMQYQADFDNNRRWLTFDLLSGVVDKHHPIGAYFDWLGVPDEPMRWLCDHALAPDVMGINYYITSERYLDRRYKKYPTYCRGGNDQQIYADVEAVRVRRKGLLGVKALLIEASERYHRPLVITEAHLGCTREDQLRWLHEIWTQASEARQAGVDLRAITAWSLFGSYDWNSLLTRTDGHYEPGAFDLRGPAPRPTALATLISELASGSTPSHPVLDGVGWWRRDERLTYATQHGPKKRESVTGAPLLLITNGDALGSAIKVCCQHRGLAVRVCKQSSCDFSNPRFLDDLLIKVKPWAIIYNGDSRGDPVGRRDPKLCHRQNVLEPAMLATTCRTSQIPFLAFSSSLVFGAERDQPYRESDLPNPICAFGRMKAQAELRILDQAPRALVIRPGAYLDISSKRGFLVKSLQALSNGVPCSFDAITVSLTYLPEIVNTGMDLLIDGSSGIWHLAGEGAATWKEVAQELASKIRPQESNFFLENLPEANDGAPAYRPLTSERGFSLSSWKIAISRYLDDHQTLLSCCKII